MKYIVFIIAILLAVSIKLFASSGGAQHIVFGPFFTAAGVLYPSPKIYHYAAGTTTAKNCWSDEGKVTAVAQPFVGDTSGIARMFCDGDYKFRIDTTADLTLYTWDNVKVTSDTATLWEGNAGTAYPSATATNRWQLFAKHDASNVFQELGINNGVSFTGVNTKPYLPSSIAYEDEANTFTSAQTFSVGSASAPSINFSGQTTDGLFSKSATQVGEAVNGVEVGFFDSSGNRSITGSYASSKSCATGFTREGPNFCRRNTLAINTQVDAVACTGRQFDIALPTDAIQVKLAIRWTALSNDAVGTRTNVTNFWADAVCTSGAIANSFYATREYTAVTANTTIGVDTDHLIVKVVNSAGVMKVFTTQLNAGGNGNADMEFIVEGYWD